ncbi:MAG: hypothetical protein FJX29_08075, partial [Alphaproteobacteria bacterium]|nr:hypothetical protein [Alphaproteobacteria bacterium]
PQFDFSRSSNLRSATPLWPAPERFTDSGMDTFGYKSRVIFPIMAQPASSDAPVRLRLTLDYAACEKICVPGKVELELEIDPRRPAPRAAARIAQFAARAPQPMQGPQAPALTLEPGATEKSWLARVAPPLTPPPVSAGFKADLFIEGPDGWFFDTKPRGEGLFEIMLAEKPAGASQLPEVTVTVTDPTGAFERKAKLPASGHP